MSETQEEKNNILWTVAGFKKEIIKDCKADAHHATMIGVLLIIVGIYAAIAWTLFFLSVINNFFFAIPLGIFMGFFIFFLDRALIASLAKTKQDFSLRFLISSGFRILLALLIGYVLAEPVVNAIYSKDIEREAKFLINKKNSELKTQLETEYAKEITNLTTKKNTLTNELDRLEETAQTASDAFLKEIDGSGGSGNRGYKTIAKKKEQVSIDKNNEYTKLQSLYQPKIENIDLQISKLEEQITKDYNNYKEETSAIGPLLQSEALQSLKKKDNTNTLKYKHWLLLAILALIELSAFIVKLIYTTKSYTSKIETINIEEQNLHQIQQEITLEKQKLYKEVAIKNEHQLMHTFFDETETKGKEKIKELVNNWKTERHSLHNLWLQFKRNFRY